MAFSTLKPGFESRWRYKNMFSHNLNLRIFLEELISFFLIGIISIFSVSKIINLAVGSQISAPADFMVAISFGFWHWHGHCFRFDSHCAWRLVFETIFSFCFIFRSNNHSRCIFIPDIWAFIFSLFFVSIYILVPYVWLHDLVLILTLPGIVALLGASLNPWTVVLVLIFMSVYDYVAVYKTKHMVKMAKAMITGRAIFAMIFPEHWRALWCILTKRIPVRVL